MIAVDRESDNMLIQAYIAGDEDAISSLIIKYKTKIYNYILLVVKNDVIADDIFQELYIKVSQSLKRGKYSDNGKFLSWVLRIAHNQIIDHYRILKQRKNVSLENPNIAYESEKATIEENIEEKLIGQQMKNDIRRLVDTLSMEQREVIIMRHYLDMSFKEIALNTGVSINTALGRMRYALINLRKLMDMSSISIEMPLAN